MSKFLVFTSGPGDLCVSMYLDITNMKKFCLVYT